VGKRFVVTAKKSE